MKLGMLAPFVEGFVTGGGFLRDFAATVEECGVESLWFVEHVVVAEDYEPRYPYSQDGRIPGLGAATPMPDPLETIAFLAGATSSLRFGTAMVVAPLHSPVVLAKRAATIDRLSGARLMLGLGIGWQREEYAAVGAAFDRRGARLDDCIGAMRELWASDPATYQGTFTGFERVRCLPRPESGAVPIVLGGNSDAAVRRAGRVGDGWFPYTIAPEEFGKQVAAVREAGRAVEVTVWPGSCDWQRGEDVEFTRRYVEHGVDRLVLAPDVTGMRARGLDAVRVQVDRYRADVLERL